MCKMAQLISTRHPWACAVGLLIIASFLLPSALPAGHAEPGAKQGATDIEPEFDEEALAFFEQHARPILEKRCVKCHGGEKIKGGLSFANRTTMLKGGESGELIDWNQHEKSLFVTAISYTDIDYEMPPAGKMKEKDIETLKKWVAMGLPWTPGKEGNLVDPLEGAVERGGPPSIEEGKQYWAYKPVIKPDVPKVDDPAWSKHPVDAFLYDKLQANGLEPNTPASRITLIRRASYNLTGLPPTPQEVHDFVNDHRPDAWERVIDRLLASPHYGEHWARHWMDIARYAETNGYERDNKKRNIWRYRDYLIRAFNDDTPYDHFIKENVAGDLLPDRDSDSYIATGFNRLQIWDDEPTDRVQARADYIADIVDTTSAAFLATTMGCARCHDHKKDPIAQSDYYALYAFYNNIQEMIRGQERRISKDLHDVGSSEVEKKKYESWQKRVAELRKRIADEESVIQEAVKEEAKAIKPIAIVPDSREKLQQWRYVTKAPANDWNVQQFDDSAWPTTKGGFGKGVERAYFPNEWGSDAIWLRKNFRLTKMPEHFFFSTTHEGGIEVYINGINVHNGPDPNGPDHKRYQFRPETLKALVIGSNSLAIKVTKSDGQRQYVDFGIYEGVTDRNVAIKAAVKNAGERVLGKERFEAYQSAKSDLGKLLAAPVSKPYPALVLNEQGRGLPKQKVHMRGSANALGEEVPARFPLVLGGAVPEIPELPKDINANGRRLALADWLASPDNPLTARVMANRIWQHQFGRGIVRSTSDFGQLGTPPTHPELLDYLAVTFVEKGWSVKEMNKFIMTSKAYQMSSSSQKAGLDIDPGNDLFWRFDMRRLSAEEFRDSLLAVNGSLNPKQFGPSIYTKMPAEVLATASRPDQAWGKSSEAERDRRSVYIHIKRSLREPLLASLDQAETDSPCPVRFATTVPTQSLITLNSEVMQDEAIVFAQRLQKEAGPELADQVRLGLRLVLTREPSDKEVESNVAFVKDVMKTEGLSADQALKLFCLIAYNLNEFMYLD